MRTSIKILILLLSAGIFPASAAAMDQEISTLTAPGDAVILASPDGKALVSVNGSEELVPASTLKILTSLFALHTLGEDFRFMTKIYLDGDHNLYIKGYGDPLLISEVLDDLAGRVAAKLKRAGVSSVKGIILDASHFKSPIKIPGTSGGSDQPYDAPSGALCANFNTVFFRKESEVLLSAEPQTPLLPFVKGRIEKGGLKGGRIMLKEKECTLYPGLLVRYFLEKRGYRVSGPVAEGRTDPERDRLLLTFTSPFSLRQVISKLLKYSNNYIANQLLLASGIKIFKAPGTLEKGVRAYRDFTEKTLGLKGVRLTEGSGISRGNRVSALNMIRVLESFRPEYELLRRGDREFYKTGTLTGIRTRAGYISGRGGLYPFAVMLNSSCENHDKIMKLLKKKAEAY